MKLFKYEGKNLDELKNKAFSDLNASENELFLKIDEEVVGILKKKKYILSVLIKEDVVKYIKNYIYDITKYMGINVNVEIKLRDNMILINLFSDDCSVLIGKNGKTLDSLQLLIKNTILVKTGIKAYMLEDEVLILANRSSNPGKKGLILANSIGVVDSDYYGNPDNDGHIMFAFFNIKDEDVEIKKGDAIGQGIFQKFLTVDNDLAKGERIGGFGSTSKN